MVRRATVDTTQAQSFEATEPGPYQMVVDEIEDPAVSQKSGSTGMWVYFKFADPTVQRRAGRVRKWYALNGEGSGFFREFWKAATGEDIPMGSDAFDVDLDDAQGRSVIVLVGNETYEGRLQNTVERVSAAS